MHTTIPLTAPRAPRGLAMCAEEPFRIFFPLGLLAGIAGLLLWPLFLWGIWKVYPSVIHARLTIEGFMGAFIFGFLGTAGPRLLNAPTLSRRELGTLLALFTASMGFHLAGLTAAGDALYLALLLTFIGVLAPRFLASAEFPPPNFVLVGCGLLSGMVGIALLLTAFAFPRLAALYALGNLLLYQGFVLLPVLGVGVFLFPRFVAGQNGSAMPQFPAAGLLRRKKAALAGATAAAIFASFVIESFWSVRWGGALRFGAAALYVGTQIPHVLTAAPGPFLGQCVCAAMWMLLLGLLWPVLLPGYRIAGLHLVFIGGFMLTTLTVGTRVILGHSGQSHLFKRPLPFLIGAGIMLTIGIVARIGADFMPSVAGRNAHLLYAALMCIGAALIWGARLAPRVFIPETAE